MLDSSSSYQARNGTSHATPHVAAIASLIWGNNPAATREQVGVVGATQTDRKSLQGVALTVQETLSHWHLAPTQLLMHKHECQVVRLVILSLLLPAHITVFPVALLLCDATCVCGWLTPPTWQVREALERSAQPLDSVVPNKYTGWGLVDAVAADLYLKNLLRGDAWHGTAWHGAAVALHCTAWHCSGTTLHCTPLVMPMPSRS